MFLRELASLSGDSEKFEPKLKVLMEDIEHHVMEEEGEMFPKVEKVIGKAELEELGKQMEEEKKNFQKSQKASAGKRIRVRDEIIRAKTCSGFSSLISSLVSYGIRLLF